mmetsp:Transcript_12725/g.25167  ORF Transcript_12725/g.25167 Transcript_12725/m.25167 type:complete len:212 (-) Transcript_12725:77-712(-)
MTLLVSRSQHFTSLSSPTENMYGCLSLTARPLTGLMCPVRVSFSSPDARSHSLMVLSPAPVANHSFVGSNAQHRTHPRCPAMTRISFQGACHSGRGIMGPLPCRTMSWFPPLAPAFLLTTMSSSPLPGRPSSAPSAPFWRGLSSSCMLESTLLFRCTFASSPSGAAAPPSLSLMLTTWGGGGRSLTTEYSARNLTAILSFLGASSSPTRAP